MSECFLFLTALLCTVYVVPYHPRRLRPHDIFGEIAVCSIILPPIPSIFFHKQTSRARAINH